jgi:hypothetical protein
MGGVGEVLQARVTGSTVAKSRVAMRRGGEGQLGSVQSLARSTSRQVNLARVPLYDVTDVQLTTDALTQ